MSVSFRSLMLFVIALLLYLQSTQVHASSEKQIQCLAQAIFYEAQAEPYLGKVAVANVIMNRVKSTHFKDTPCSVIHTKGQFQWVHNRSLRKGRVYKHDKSSEIYRIASEIYIKNMLGDRKDNTANSHYFSSNGRKPALKAVRTTKVGNHQFYRSTLKPKKVSSN